MPCLLRALFRVHRHCLLAVSSNGGGGERALVSFSSYKDTKPIHSSRHPILTQQLPKQEGRGSSNTKDLRLTCLSLHREEISFPVALSRLPFISQWSKLGYVATSKPITGKEEQDCHHWLRPDVPLLGTLSWNRTGALLGGRMGMVWEGSAWHGEWSSLPVRKRWRVPIHQQ